jgi:hypothetical protein
MTVFLVSRESPWDLPADIMSTIARLDMESYEIREHWGTWGSTYHSRPPESGFVRRKGPNIVTVWDRNVGRRAQFTTPCSAKTPADFLGTQPC